MEGTNPVVLFFMVTGLGVTTESVPGKPSRRITTGLTLVFPALMTENLGRVSWANNRMPAVIKRAKKNNTGFFMIVVQTKIIQRNLTIEILTYPFSVMHFPKALHYESAAPCFRKETHILNEVGQSPNKVCRYKRNRLEYCFRGRN